MTKEVGTSNLLDTWAATGEKVEPSETKKNTGWELQEQPPHEYANWLANQIGQAVNHILQNGVPAHNTTTTYAVGNIVNVGGTLYQAKAANTNSTPPNVNWQQLAPYPVKNSIETHQGALRLKNDQDTPGNNKLYGTNGSGTKGWYDFINTSMETGDYKVSVGTGVKAGYVRANGRTIGNPDSAATERANADTEALFTLLWEINSASYVVSGGRGASAAADFAANKNIKLPDARNRVAAYLDGMGTAETDLLTTALNGKIPGSVGGAQQHQLTINEMPEHDHNWNATGTGQTTQNPLAVNNSENGYGNVDVIPGFTPSRVPKTYTRGGNAQHNNVQPTFIAGTLYIKL